MQTRKPIMYKEDAVRWEYYHSVTCRANRSILLSSKPRALAPEARLIVQAQIGGILLLFSTTELELAGDLWAVDFSIASSDKPLQDGRGVSNGESVRPD